MNGRSAWAVALLGASLVGACGGVEAGPAAVSAATERTASPSTVSPSITTVPDPRATSTTEPPPTTEPAPPEPRSFTFAMAGDVLIHDQVNRQAATYGQATGKRFDFRPMFARLRPLLWSADLAICHLEVPISPDGRFSGYPVFGAPPELTDALAWAGYDGCSTASNHSLDRGKAGIAATIDALARAGMVHSGTAKARAATIADGFYDVDGITVANLAYAWGFNGLPLPPGQPWAADLIAVPKILSDAKLARLAGADVVIVSCHWGDEYVHRPNGQQETVARQLLASPDIDLVVGHHAHVVQPIERIGAKYVVYGMGNQLSNMHQAERRDGIVLLGRFTEQPGDGFRLSGLAYVPTWVERPALVVWPATFGLAGVDLSTPFARELFASVERTLREVDRRGAEASGVRFRREPPAWVVEPPA